MQQRIGDPPAMKGLNESSWSDKIYFRLIERKYDLVIVLIIYPA